jgi:Fe-S cluster biosynthesis and repair protein YggX
LFNPLPGGRSLQSAAIARLPPIGYNRASAFYSRRSTRMAHMVVDSRYKKEMEGLDDTPFDSDFGNKIYHNVSKQSWQEWGERQKMLLNEYRLQPWTPEAQEFLVEQMQQFFFGEGSALPADYVPPTH